jgi:polyisoprenoid-binding protein YceI
MNRLQICALALALGFAGAEASAAPETYQLEKTHVDLLFSINHAGFSQKHGSFRDLDATLVYDPQKPEASQVKVTVKTDSLDTGFEARDRDVKGDKFLDTARFPQMTFVSTKVTRNAEGHLVVTGDLTLHGVTKPIVLEAHLNQLGPNPFDKRPTVGFSATGVLKRSDFGVTTYIPVIGDLVTITIDAEFNHPVK